MMHIKKQLRRLYCLEFSTSFSLTHIIWVALLIGRGFSMAQVGICEGFFHLIGFLFEVPSGMLADLLGRKRTLVAANILRSASCLCMVLVDSFLGICLSFALSALYYNLTSGTKEALTYDSLLMAGEADRYEKISARQSGLWRATSSACALLTGVVALLGWRLAYLVDGGFALVGLAFAISLREPIVTQQQAQRTENSFANFGSRLKKHLSASFGFMVKNPVVTAKMLADGAIGCGAYLGSMLLQQQYLELGLAPALLGMPLLFSGLAGTAGAMLAPKVKGTFLRVVLIGIAGISTSLMLCGLGILPIAIIGAMLLSAWDGVMEVKVGAHLNEGFPSDQRATLVSTQGLCYSLLMLPLSPLAGAVCDSFGLNAGLSMLGVGLIAGTFVGFWAYRLLLKKPAMVE